MIKLMSSSKHAKPTTQPEAIVRRVIHACADCDTCRHLMNEDCLFFPALYRLVYREDQQRNRVLIMAIVHGSRDFPRILDER